MIFFSQFGTDATRKLIYDELYAIIGEVSIAYEASLKNVIEAITVPAMDKVTVEKGVISAALMNCANA